MIISFRYKFEILTWLWDLSSSHYNVDLSFAKLLRAFFNVPSVYVVVSVENDDEKVTVAFLDEVKGSLIGCHEFAFCFFLVGLWANAFVFPF